MAAEVTPPNLTAALLNSASSGIGERARQGCSYHRGTLAQAEVDELISAVAPASTTWKPLKPTVGPVTQLANEHAAAAPEWLGELTGKLVAAEFVPASARPELTFMRYPALTGHVSPHRDRQVYIGLILVASLEGTAKFCVHGSRDEDDVLAQWVVAPGDVVVMAGVPWPDHEGIDKRPFHSVRTFDRARMSVTIRFTVGQINR